MSAIRCELCRTEHDLEIALAEGRCAIPRCGAALREGLAPAAGTAEQAAVVAGGVALLAAAVGAYAYGWELFDWVPLAIAAGSLGAAGAALSWGRESRAAQAARGLSFTALGLAYPPLVALTLLVLLALAVVAVSGLLGSADVRQRQRLVERLVGAE